MKSLLQFIVLGALLAAVAGCSNLKGTQPQGIEGNRIAGQKEAARQVKYAVTLRFNPYVDQRQVSNPRYFGKVATLVRGVSGDELLMDKEISEIVTTEMKRRFDIEGYQVLEGADGGNALFEVSGVIKTLSLDAKARDEANISIETTVKEVSTGEVYWSGVVTEKNDRFAGVTGNHKEDLDEYLDKELRIVSSKTAEAVGASMMASRPELFNLTPGTKAISGVDVLVSPPAASTAGAAVTMPGAVPASSSTANAATGTLSVSTTPSRAKVYLDGVYFGLSPLNSEIEPGVHDIVVKLKGYKTVAEKVSVRKGDKTELELSLDR